MPDKKKPTQREKFEAAAEAYEKAGGAVSDEALGALIGVAGKTKAEKENTARRKAGLPKASH